MLGLAGRFEHEAVPCRRRPARGFTGDRQSIGGKTAPARAIACRAASAQRRHQAVLPGLPQRGRAQRQFVAHSVRRDRCVPPRGRRGKDDRQAAGRDDAAARTAAPRGDTLRALIATLEKRSSTRRPPLNRIPADASFQRLNRAEYTAAIRDLLSLDIDAGVYLPPDTKSDELRQHRRRADAVADVARRVSPRGERDQSAGGRQSESDGRAPRRTTCRARRRRRSTSKARRSARAAAPRWCTRSRPTAQYLFKVLLLPRDHRRIRRRQRARTSRSRSRSTASARAVLDIDRFMTRVGSERRLDGDRTHSRSRRPASRVGGVHSAGVSRRVAGPDLAAQVVAEQHVHRDGVRFLAASAPARSGDHGPFKPTGVSDWPVATRAVQLRGLFDGGRARARESIVSRLATQAFRRPLTPSDRRR